MPTPTSDDEVTSDRCATLVAAEEQHDGQPDDRHDAPRQRPPVGLLAEDEGAERDEHDRAEGDDELGVSDARARDGGEEQGDVEPEEQPGGQHPSPRRRPTAPGGRWRLGGRAMTTHHSTTAPIIRQNATTEPGGVGPLDDRRAAREHEHGEQHREDPDRCERRSPRPASPAAIVHRTRLPQRPGASAGRGPVRWRRRGTRPARGTRSVRSGRRRGALASASLIAVASCSPLRSGSNSSLAADEQLVGAEVLGLEVDQPAHARRSLRATTRSARGHPPTPPRRSAAPSSRSPARWR